MINMSSRSRILLVIFLLGCGFLLYAVWPAGDVRHEPGVLVPENPHQGPVTNMASWEKGEYHVAPLAEFDATARILHLKRYSHGRESDLSPIDLALGWGAMSDQSVIDQIDISQSGRWYEWHVKTFPVPRRVIETCSSNMHIIPADDEVENVLGSLRQGDVIQFSGYLVEVTANDGWRWRSSLSREDVGQGACELVWVNRMSVVP
jgi:hypothetical protein